MDSNERKEEILVEKTPASNIKKLFTYSDEVTKKSGTSKANGRMILFGIIGLIICSIIYVCFSSIIGIILGVAVGIYIFKQNKDNGIDLEEKLRSYAIDNTGRIFEINLLHNFNNAGSTGQLIGGSVGGVIGGVQDIKALNQINNNLEIINNPETVSKLIETKPEQVVNIIEILKVYSVEENKTNFKVTCDLIVLTNENKQYNKTELRIKKCYTDYEKLIEELNKKRD